VLYKVYKSKLIMQRMFCILLGAFKNYHFKASYIQDLNVIIEMKRASKNTRKSIITSCKVVVI